MQRREWALGLCTVEDSYTHCNTSSKVTLFEALAIHIGFLPGHISIRNHSIATNHFSETFTHFVSNLDGHFYTNTEFTLDCILNHTA